MKFVLLFSVAILIIGCTIPNLPKPPDPTPQQDLCTDSDGGLSVYVKGTATNGTLTGVDVCNGNRILEYYCSGSGLYKLSQPCTYGCSNGRCNPQSIQPPAPTATCTDSDSGSVFTVQGTATNGTMTLTDICDGNDLIEYFCSGTVLYELSQPCTYGCSAGRCNPQSITPGSECTDTDGGQDVNTKGIAAKGTLILSDTCNGTSILEYFCSENDMYELSQVCPYGCSNGRCNSASDPQPLSCSDTDGGITYNTKGTVTRGTYTGTDYCFTTNPQIVSEYYCKSDGTVGSETYTCPNTCSDGQCITSSVPDPVPDDNSCTSHTSCGYKKRCIGGECVSVQCTSDSQCSGCKKCSTSWSCVNCGYGASGYCTC